MDEKLLAFLLSRAYDEFLWNAPKEIAFCPKSLEYFREELKKLIISTWKVALDKQPYLNI